MKQAQKFIEKMMANKAFRNKLTAQLKWVEEGDWDAIIAIAKAEGFHFKVQDLMKAIPEGFFKGKGKNPNQGWDQKTLKRKKSKTKSKAKKPKPSK